jgi:hypothetical protein
VVENFRQATVQFNHRRSRGWLFPAIGPAGLRRGLPSQDGSLQSALGARLQPALDRHAAAACPWRWGSTSGRRDAFFALALWTTYAPSGSAADWTDEVVQN